MSKHEPEADAKNRESSAPSPSAAPAPLNLPALPPDSTLASQVATLHRLPTAQRQTMLKRMGTLHGNHRIQRAISAQRPGTPTLQTKLSVNEPGDRFEQEAEQVADAVLQEPGAAAPPRLTPAAPPAAPPPAEGVESQAPRALDAMPAQEEPASASKPATPQPSVAPSSERVPTMTPTDAARPSLPPSAVAASPTPPVAAPPALADALPVRPAEESAGNPLATLQELPATEWGEAATRAAQAVPDHLATQRQMFVASLPSALRTPMGMATLSEVTGETALLPAAERLPAPERSETPTAPAVPATQSPDGRAERKTFQAEQAEAAQQADKAAQAANPDHLQTHRHTNTSAGPRPKAALAGATDPHRIGQQQGQAAQQVEGLVQQSTLAAQQEYGEQTLYPPVAPTRNPLVRQESPTAPPPAPDAEASLAWPDLTQEMASQPTVQEQLTKQRTRQEEALTQAETKLERAAQTAKQLEAQQGEAGEVAGTVREAAALPQSPALTTRVADWQAQEEPVTAALAGQQEQVVQADEQAQQQRSDAEAALATLPTGDDLAARMAAHAPLKAALDEEAAPEIAAQSATLQAEYETQRSAQQEQIESRWAESRAMVAQHESDQQARLADIQQRAQGDVAQMKADWQAENEATRQTFHQESATATRQGAETIRQTVTEGEAEAARVLGDAEQSATTVKEQAESAATQRVADGRARAEAILGRVGLPMSGNHETGAVGTIMRREDEGDDAAAARQAAESEMEAAIREADEALARMEEEVQAILDDATLTAEEKVQRVNDVVQETIEEVNTIISDLRDDASNVLEQVLAFMGEVLIEQRLNEAVAEVSTALLEDETVAARVTEIQQQIMDGTGNIIIDTSTFTGPFSIVPSVFFRLHVRNALDHLMQRPAGLELIMQLMAGDNTVTIRADRTALAGAQRVNPDAALEQADGAAGAGSDTIVLLHPNLGDDNIRLQDVEDNEIPGPFWLILGHELIHALHNGEGRNASNQAPSDPEYTNMEEERTIDAGDLTENDLREQFNVSEPRYGHGGNVVNDPRNP